MPTYNNSDSIIAAFRELYRDIYFETYERSLKIKAIESGTWNELTAAMLGLPYDNQEGG